MRQQGKIILLQIKNCSEQMAQSTADSFSWNAWNPQTTEQIRHKSPKINIIVWKILNYAVYLHQGLHDWMIRKHTFSSATMIGQNGQAVTSKYIIPTKTTNVWRRQMIMHSTFGSYVQFYGDFGITYL